MSYNEDYGSFDYNIDLDFAYTNPLDEISTSTKVVVCFILIGLCVLGCCGYCCLKLCSCVFRPVGRRCKPIFLAWCDNLRGRDPGYRKIVAIADSTGIKPVPTYQEYLLMREEINKNPLFEV